MNALYYNDIIRKQPPQEGNNETCAHKHLKVHKENKELFLLTTQYY